MYAIRSYYDIVKSAEKKKAILDIQNGNRGFGDLAETRNNFVQHTLYEVIRYILAKNYDDLRRITPAYIYNYVVKDVPADSQDTQKTEADQDTLNQLNHNGTGLSAIQPEIPDYVITSYSIHYTKLYDVIRVFT